MPHYVYILRSLKDGSLYIGATRNLTDRLLRHNEGRSVYTRHRGPWVLIHSEEHATRLQALRRERYLKSFKSPAAVIDSIKQGQDNKHP